MQMYKKPELDLIDLDEDDVIVTSPPVRFHDNESGTDNEYEGGIVDGHQYDPGVLDDPGAET